MISPQDIANIRDLPTLLAFLSEKLDWPIDPDGALDEITFDYSADELRLTESAAHRLQGGAVRQLVPFTNSQPWGVFLVEFTDERLYRAALRQILRGLVPSRRQAANQKAWQHENLLFICTTRDYRKFTFAHFRGRQATRAILSTFGWQQGETHIRTLCEYNLPALAYPDKPADREAWLAKWRQAFDVETVTEKFFTEYRSVFEQMEQEAGKSVRDAEACRLYTQRLFNRLMFIYFIQKKGWLSYEGDRSYLRALYRAAEAKDENFLRDRLYWLFFWGMSNVGESREVHDLAALRARRGEVPYLNGGLFDMEDELDGDRDRVKISNRVFDRVLTLFERYNFTVTESTPLDVQVAVDPEMLGKVFEELVTGRHESGSYYTPRPIVSFMCREALKYYLGGVEKNADAVAGFVDEEDASGLGNAEAVFEALKRVRVCDPACGSGAYLLGMLQELMRLRAALFKSNRLDDRSLYERKRSMIENNLYGVDKDRFAVQIACLRLWLSLAIESEKPQPLPNLDFKIGCGDSLTAPAPNAAENLLDLSRGALVQQYRQRKAEFIHCNEAGRKKQLRDEIEALRAEIAVELKHQPKRPNETKIRLIGEEAARLRREIERAGTGGEGQSAKRKQLALLERELSAWSSGGEEADQSFDWAVEFAEVFSPETAETARWDGAFAFMNEVGGQQVFAERGVTSAGGGFDIVMANPPYVRMELFKEIKPVLRRNFPETHSDRADLYVYFFDRAQQLLKAGGVGCFISSNKWLRAGYGENLRRALLDKQAFHLIVDFKDLPVFKATAYPAIFIWQKDDRRDALTVWAEVRDLNECYAEGIREHVGRIAHRLPSSQFGEGKSRLTVSAASNRHEIMAASGMRLAEYTGGKICWGIKTGLNEAFIIARETRNQLIRESPESREVIKPLLKGDDVRRYEIHYRDAFLLYMNHGVDPRRYPAVVRYLRPFKEKLEKRATEQEWYELQQPQAAYVPFFNRPKIIFPDIAKEIRFALETRGFFSSNTTYFIPREDAKTGFSWRF